MRFRRSRNSGIERLSKRHIACEPERESRGRDDHSERRQNSRYVNDCGVIESAFFRISSPPNQLVKTCYRLPSTACWAPLYKPSPGWVRRQESRRAGICSRMMSLSTVNSPMLSFSIRPRRIATCPIARTPIANAPTAVVPSAKASAARPVGTEEDRDLWSFMKAILACRRPG